MKKLLLVIPCLIWGLSARCQSVSVKDIVEILHDKDVSQLITKKAFSLVGSDLGDFKTYVKNSRSANQEKIYIAGPSVTYSTKSKAFVHQLLVQLKSKYRATIKDDKADYVFYQFEDQGTRVSVNVPKAGSEYCTVTARNK